MGKTNRIISIDSDINDMLKIKRAEEPDFNVSQIINDFLWDLFGEETKDLDQRKISARKKELERELAFLKSQEKRVEYQEKKQEQEEFEKEFGRGAKLEPFKG